MSGEVRSLPAAQRKDERKSNRVLKKEDWRGKKNKKRGTERREEKRERERSSSLVAPPLLPREAHGRSLSKEHIHAPVSGRHFPASKKENES